MAKTYASAGAEKKIKNGKTKQRRSLERWFAPTDKKRFSGDENTSFYMGQKDNEIQTNIMERTTGRENTKQKQTDSRPYENERKLCWESMWDEKKGGGVKKDEKNEKRGEMMLLTRNNYENETVYDRVGAHQEKKLISG